MAIASTNDGWRMMIVQDDGDFMRDQLKLVIAQKVEGGYLPVTISIEKGELLSWVEVTDTALPASAIPTELCELLLSTLAQYLLSARDGDMVATIRRLERELSHSNRRLDDLISGIGRLGHGSTGE